MVMTRQKKRPLDKSGFNCGFNYVRLGLIMLDQADSKLKVMS